MEAITEFQAGGALAPSNSAYSAEVYRGTDSAQTLSSNFLGPGPVVVGSPALTGKSTLLNTICSEYTRVDAASEVIEVDCGQDSGLDQDSLRDAISQELQSEDQTSFTTLVATRRRATRSLQRSSLRFRNADSLNLDALRWLLGGLRRLGQKAHHLESGGLAILVDGAFTTQTLTSGPDSDFPLDQVYPDEFTPASQSQFLKLRFAKHGTAVTSAALKQLFQQTSGDKYLTQVLGRDLAVSLSPKEKVDASAMRTALAGAVASPRSARRLKRRIVRYLCRTKQVFSRLVRGTSAHAIWAESNIDERAPLFQSGVIRRVSPISVTSRCPLVLDFLGQAFGRLQRVDHFLTESLALESGMPQSYGEMEKVIRRIRKSAAIGTLRSAHAGSGIIVGPGQLHIEARTLASETYEGYLEVAEADLPPTCREVWFVRWTRATKNNSLKSQLHFWPVRP